MDREAPGRAVQLPYSATEWATLRAAFPLSEDAWTQMLAVLSAMKPALVVCAQSGPPTDGGEAIAQRLEAQADMLAANDAESASLLYRRAAALVRELEPDARNCTDLLNQDSDAPERP